LELISYQTGGTAKTLKEAGIKVTDVSDYTGFPEMMEGRVKTLHPKIHGGILALRSKKEHLKEAKEHDIELIDLVVVNLYPFEDTVKKAPMLNFQILLKILISAVHQWYAQQQRTLSLWR